MKCSTSRYWSPSWFWDDWWLFTRTMSDLTESADFLDQDGGLGITLTLIYTAISLIKSQEYFLIFHHLSFRIEYINHFLTQSLVRRWNNVQRMNICSAERQEEKVSKSILENNFVELSNNVFMIISHEFLLYFCDDAKVLEIAKRMTRSIKKLYILLFFTKIGYFHSMNKNRH